MSWAVLHSSRPAIAHWLKQPTRVQYGPSFMNPYLALLQGGVYRAADCYQPRGALYAPFHPYLIPLARAIGGLLSVALVVGCDTPRRYLAPCPMEPGLSSPPPVSPRRTTTKRRLSGQLRRAVSRVYRPLSSLSGHPNLQGGSNITRRAVNIIKRPAKCLFQRRNGS